MPDFVQQLLHTSPMQRFARLAVRAKHIFFVGLFCVLFGYLFLSLLSYNATDTAWSHVSGMNLPVGVTQENVASNIVGFGGAWIADILYMFFGMGAWAVLLWVGHEIYCAYCQKMSPASPLRLLAYGFLWFCLCIVLYARGFADEQTTDIALGLKAGGIVGFEGHLALANLLGETGALLFALSGIVMIGFLLVDWKGCAKRQVVAKTTKPKKEHLPKTVNQAISATVQEYQPHNHEGALDSFLQISGLRADLKPELDEMEAAEVAVPVVPVRPKLTPKMKLVTDYGDGIASVSTNYGHGVPDHRADLGVINETHPAPSQPIAPPPSHVLASTLMVAHDDKVPPPQNQAWQADRHQAFEGIVLPDMLADNHQADSFEPMADIMPKTMPNNEPHKKKHPSMPNLMTDHQSQQSAPPPTPSDKSQAWYQSLGQNTHIADDDTPNQPVPRPDIHDDKTFAKRSFAMQTDKYRQQLSPIPSLDLLDPVHQQKTSYSSAQLTQLSELLEIKLKEFNVNAQVMNVVQGPVVTSFEVALAAGVKASKVTNIAQDLARSLSMASLRVVEVIAGKPYIGIEIPNRSKQTVKLIELLQDNDYRYGDHQIAMAMGKDIGGKTVITDLAKAPHMLVAGTTGSGKSVLVNAMLLSMLLKYTPDELRLILIDPKMLELANYSDIPHLLTPVVTDMTEAASALSWCVGEMERRYQLMSLLKVRKLSEFNKKVNEANLRGEPLLDPLWRLHDSVSMDKPPKLKPLPLIVVVADEFADMIMQVGKQAEELITRLAQKSRAAGIHLMLATQRPSVDVITGLIKANIPSRAALRVNSKVDSRTILDSGGAEDMLGHGDMLFLAPGKNEPMRVHGAYVTDEEVNRVCDAWRERGAPEYIDTVTTTAFELGESRTSGSGEDILYDEALAFIMDSGKTSISALQRRLSIGYNRAANIIESMEKNGILSPPDNTGKRHIMS